MRSGRHAGSKRSAAGRAGRAMKLMWSALISPPGLILVHATVFPFRVLESFILFIRGLF